MSKGILDILLDRVMDENWTGKYGEKLTERELKFVQFFGRKGKILKNIYLPKDNGETSEVDVIFITKKGIFVFESKNYSGWIFGDENNRNWTAMLPNRQKNSFYNPVMQNRTHLKWMKNYVGEEIPLFSIIVFSERCELKKVTIHSEDVKVIKRDRIYAVVRDYWNKHADVLSEAEIADLYEKLKVLTDVDQAVKVDHIKNIEKKYKKTESTYGTKIIQFPHQKNICPKCGKELVLRVAQKGEHAGRQFYGCSGFPQCRYIQNI